MGRIGNVNPDETIKFNKIANQSNTTEFKKFILHEGMSLGVDLDGEIWVIGSENNFVDETLLNMSGDDDPVKIMHKTNICTGLKNMLCLSPYDNIEFEGLNFFFGLPILMATIKPEIGE